MSTALILPTTWMCISCAAAAAAAAAAADDDDDEEQMEMVSVCGPRCIIMAAVSDNTRMIACGTGTIG